MQFTYGLTVPLDVSPQLREPIALVSCRSAVAAFAAVLVPKATMHKYHLVEAREDQVRVAWKVSSMKSVSVTH